MPTKAAKNPPDTKYGHSDLFNLITRENAAGSMFSSSSSSPGFFSLDWKLKTNSLHNTEKHHKSEK